MEVREREINWLWLCTIKGLYRPHIYKLLEYFGSPTAIFQASESEIADCRALSAEQKTSIVSSRRDFDPVKMQDELAQKEIRFISVDHEEYPKRLKEIIDYPYGLFLKGRLPSETKPAVAIVGSRRCSYYGRKTAERIAESLSRNDIQIISGMAIGIDGYAQIRALATGGQSYGVLGSGVDICYPRQNKGLYEQLITSGGILSEYPPGREPLAFHFPIRNRIISGLADCLVVVEAKEKSGSLITADLALDQGKDIFAVPGRMDDPLSSGCNRLISQGAGIFLSEQELLKSIGIDDKIKCKMKKNNFLLETKEKLVYSCVDFTPKSLDEIILQAKMPVEEVMAALTLLEIKGHIEEPVKNYYAKVD